MAKRKRKPKKRDYAKEYERRLRRGVQRGQTPEQARGHHKKPQKRIRKGTKARKIFVEEARRGVSFRSAGYSRTHKRYPVGQYPSKEDQLREIRRIIRLTEKKVAAYNRRHKDAEGDAYYRATVRVEPSADYAMGFKEIPWDLAEGFYEACEAALGVMTVFTWTP